MNRLAKVLFSTCLCVLVLSSNVCAKTVITEGVAVIGSGITLEEAKLIALNDARQKALNSLGVFVESETKVVNYRLTKDEIRTISGAIITSEMLESKKEIIEDVFVLKMKFKFDISKSSLHNALKNYQDRSKDRRTISHLIKTIERLQEDLVKEKKGTPETVEIVDDIEFSTKRLGKLLTTKQVIDYELQMQNIYKKKAETYFKNVVFPKFYDELTKLLAWTEIPELKYGSHLVLQFVGFRISKEEFESRFQKYVSCLSPIAREYDALNLKVRPTFSYSINFKIPIYVYLNTEKLTYYIGIEFDRSDIADASYDLIIKSFDYGNLMFFGGSSLLGSAHMYSGPCPEYWNIELPKSYKLSDIENIEVRVGRVNTRSIEFSFFR